jgi:hypothetical protein
VRTHGRRRRRRRDDLPRVLNSTPSKGDDHRAYSTAASAEEIGRRRHESSSPEDDSIPKPERDQRYKARLFAEAAAASRLRRLSQRGGDTGVVFGRIPRASIAPSAALAGR